MILLDLIVIAVFSLIFAIGLLSHYGPRIKDMEKTYENLTKKFKDRLDEMHDAERVEFMDSLSSDTRQFYDDIMNENLHFQEFTQWGMNESMKAVTPFDHGGYVQGPGFNPSDTMDYQMNQDMNQFNHMDSGMSDPFNGF